MTGEPPLSVGSSQVTVTDRSPRTATTLRGGPGLVAGVNGTSIEPSPSPRAFTANTRTKYSVPLVRPVISRLRLAGSGTVAWRLDWLNV